jgi:arabinogalactan oligomer/maltooligosaccharide transport system permease protein
MDKKITTLNQKYCNFIPLSGLLLVLSIFLPFFRVKDSQISKAMIRIFAMFINDRALFDKSRTLQIIILLMASSVLLVLAASVLCLILRKKVSVIISLTAFLFASLSAVIVLFTIASAINASGLMEGKFLVKYLGWGYWGFLILSIAGLVLSMLAYRISPGYIVLTVLSVIWLIPIAWIVMISFRAEPGSYTSYFFPKKFTLDNYITLLTDNSQFHYVKWFMNTVIVAAASCLLTSIIVLSTSYTLSRLRFKGRKRFMDILLVLGMFPGFMSMIAVYYILKGLGITQSLLALVMVYSGGAAMKYYIAKGFFDTIPRSLDEAAYIDGATKWYVFTRITIPLSKPIIMYTLLEAFMVPWADYIFASVIMGDKYENYTLALGLYLMLDRTNIATWYTRFAAGAVLVSIPIAILFIALQKYYSASLTGSVKG